MPRRCCAVIDEHRHALVPGGDDTRAADSRSPAPDCRAPQRPGPSSCTGLRPCGRRPPRGAPGRNECRVLRARPADGSTSGHGRPNTKRMPSLARQRARSSPPETLLMLFPPRCAILPTGGSKTETRRKSAETLGASGFILGVRESDCGTFPGVGTVRRRSRRPVDASGGWRVPGAVLAFVLRCHGVFAFE